MYDWENLWSSSRSFAHRHKSFTPGGPMERIIEVLATLLLRELGQTIKIWSARIQRAENDKPEKEIKPSQYARCPLRPRFPDPDYLEAMIGDLLEWQNYLKEQGLSECRILVLTLLGMSKLAIDILQITLQNMFETSKQTQQAEVIESAIAPEGSSENNPPDTEPI